MIKIFIENINFSAFCVLISIFAASCAPPTLDTPYAGDLSAAIGQSAEAFISSHDEFDLIDNSDYAEFIDTSQSTYKFSYILNSDYNLNIDESIGSNNGIINSSYRRYYFGTHDETTPESNRRALDFFENLARARIYSGILYVCKMEGLNNVGRGCRARDQNGTLATLTQFGSVVEDSFSAR